MSDFNITLSFISKRDKIIEMLNISIAVLFLELSIYKKTIESSLLGGGVKDEIKKFQHSSKIAALEEELDNKRKTVFALVKCITQNQELLLKPIRLQGQTATIIDNKNMNWFGNIIPLKDCTKAELELAEDLKLPINPLCKHKHSLRSHIKCKAFYDRRYPATFRFCDEKNCVGCQLAKVPQIRERKKLFISDDDLEKIMKGIELYS